MSQNKDTVKDTVVVGNSDDFFAGDPTISEKRGTEFDDRDMHRMGKLPQLRVDI